MREATPPTEKDGASTGHKVIPGIALLGAVAAVLFTIKAGMDGNAEPTAVAPSPPPSVVSAPTKAVSCWSQVPEPTGIEHMRAINIRDAVKAMDVRVRPQDQFETDDGFSQRIEAAQREVRFGTCGVGDVLIFEIKPVYDPSRGAYVLETIRPSHSEARTTGTYTATNAYGAKATVTERETTDYALHAEPRLSFEISMAPDAARAIDPGLRVWLFAKLVPPFLTKYRGVEPATFSKPTEEASYSYILSGQALEAWVIDMASHQVISRHGARNDKKCEPNCGK